MVLCGISDCRLPGELSRIVVVEVSLACRQSIGRCQVPVPEAGYASDAHAAASSPAALKLEAQRGARHWDPHPLGMPAGLPPTLHQQKPMSEQCHAEGQLAVGSFLQDHRC